MQESVIYQDILQKGLQQGLQQGKQEGLQQGKQEEALSLIMRLLTRRFGEIDSQLQERVQRLSLVQLEELSEALLDFEAVTNLTVWLDEYQTEEDDDRSLPPSD
jgi:predicted transposase YdaD